MIFKENGRTLEWIWATTKGKDSRALVDWNKGEVVCAFVVKKKK